LQVDSAPDFSDAITTIASYVRRTGQRSFLADVRASSDEGVRLMTRCTQRNAIRILLVALAASAVFSIASRAWAQAAPLSDYLFVSATLTATPNNPNPQTTFPITEDATGVENVVAVPLKDVLIRPGYVALYEPDGQTLSDVLVSVTGASLQLYSDGAQGFPPNVAGLPDLNAGNAKFIEDPVNGLTASVGDLFAIAGGFPVAAGDIKIFSDGDVPEPGTLMLFAISLVGLIAFRSRKANNVI
jgi:PEP-CTERM motif